MGGGRGIDGLLPVIPGERKYGLIPGAAEARRAIQWEKETLPTGLTRILRQGFIF